MTLRSLVASFALLFAPAAFAAPVFDEPAVPSIPSQFQLAEQTAVPNATLKPGSYSIRILDHLRDRVIIQVQDRRNKIETTFIAIPAATMSGVTSGPIAYSSGPKGKAAMKGFAFPGGVAVEFVYPKNDAVSIAKANSTRVMAIDPGSEGRVEASKLNQDDMQMVTLWMLEPSRVGPNDPTPTGIAASKYQAPQSTGAELAQAQPTSSPTAPTSNYNASSTTPSGSPAVTTTPRRQRPVQVAQNDVPPSPVRTHVRPAVKALPHTAGSMPLVALAGLLSFAFGGTLTLRRLSTNA